MNTLEKINDAWMEQADVQNQIIDPSVWSSEWLKVYEIRNSYVEHFIGFFLPLSPQRAFKALGNISWGMDFDYSRGQIAKVRIGHTHYLGLKFRRYFALACGPHGYWQSGKLVARREIQDEETQKTDTIFVKRDAVVKYACGTKQVLQWCVRSQRFSERHLQEFGLEEKCDRRHDEHCHYEIHQMKITARQQAERPRMISMTEVFGKAIVGLTDE